MQKGCRSAASCAGTLPHEEEKAVLYVSCVQARSPKQRTEIYVCAAKDRYMYLCVRI